MKIQQNADMKEFTSFKAGGPVSEMVIPETVDELVDVIKKINIQALPYIILGNGTNTLITDDGFDGIVVKIGEAFSEIKTDGDYIISGGGALLSTVAKAALNDDLTGMEFASGIPGSIGGAVCMNAGAYGGEIKDILEEVTIVKGNGTGIKTIPVEELELGYRHSSLMDTSDIVVSAKFRLSKGEHAEIAAKMADFTRRRNEKQPVQYPSAGSFFKRPEGYYAGKLIEDAGLKGVAVGDAQVSEKHCGFIINKGEASATDIIRLMNLVQTTVHDRFGIMLEPEVRIIGD